MVAMPAVSAMKKPKEWDAHPPIHIKRSGTLGPTGLSPAQIIHAYGFDKLSCYGTNSCGSGQTIAIVDAYDDPNIANDLNTFDTQFGLPSCTTANGCFTKATPQGLPAGNTGWALEESLDVEWAHAIAPGAKIILVEAKNSFISSMLSAVDYAVTQPNVHQVSMSWGGGDSVDDSTFDSHFNVAGISFTASAGDSGSGVLYPAASPYVVSVGGTALNVDGSGNVQSETAWSGSGGGVSLYESKPSYQNGFNSNSGRGIPDVSYDADPNTGVSVYDSYGYGGWVQVGGTSVGAPQWAAAISIINGQRTTPFSASSFDANTNLYSAAGGTSYNLNNIYFRDITSGTNGNCGSICTAALGYDFVTGLGSPLSNNLIPYLSPPPAPTVPSHPTNLLANPVSSSQINLSWTAPTDNGGSTITGYMIERSADSGSTWSTIVPTTGSTGTTYPDTGLTAGTTYTYRVSAINAIGTSSPSNTASATTSTTTSPTTLTLNAITPASVPWGTSVTVSGKLTITSGGAGLGGKTITFSGTGAANLLSVVTSSDGTFSASGASPSSVLSGWTVQAHFAGDSQYLGADSAVNTYNTLIHGTVFWSLNVPASIPHGSIYTVDGKLKDSTTGLFLPSKTVTFTATSPIVIPNAVTDSTGKYSASGLVAPAAGSYNIQAHFAGDSLYTSSNSPTKVLKTT